MKWLRTETNDHVLIKVELCIAIGVNETADDLPEGFTADLRKAITDLGVGVITSSISPMHRQAYKATAREIIAKQSETKK